ncbi:hypothetical protein AAMO2058_000070200 [Amorphochlora amoebiformis]
MSLGVTHSRQNVSQAAGIEGYVPISISNSRNSEGKAPPIPSGGSSYPWQGSPGGRVERNLRRNLCKKLAQEERAGEAGGRNKKVDVRGERKDVLEWRKKLEKKAFMELRAMVKERGIPLPKFVNKKSLIDCLIYGKQPVTPRSSKAKQAQKWRLRPLLDQPYHPIDKINWKSAIGCHRSDTGAGGVFFVKFPKGVVVLKSCADMAQQLFASTVVSWLGIRSAKCRVIDTQSSEGRTCIIRLKSFNQSASHKLSRMRYMLLFEFLPGHALKYFRPNDFKMMCSLRPHPSATTFMERSCWTMGRLSALDALLYYDADRLPIVCQTRGNGGNIILSPGNFSVCAIDNGANFINPQNSQRVKKYFEDIASVFKSFLSNTQKVSKPMEAVRKMIVRYSSWSPPDSFLLPIQNGFLAGARDILREFPTTGRINTLYNMISAVKPPIPGISGLNIRFISSVLNTYRSSLPYTTYIPPAPFSTHLPPFGLTPPCPPTSSLDQPQNPFKVSPTPEKRPVPATSREVPPPPVGLLPPPGKRPVLVNSVSGPAEIKIQTVSRNANLALWRLNQVALQRRVIEEESKV